MDWRQLGEDAARGAAAGSVAPGIGTALGAAGAIALNLAPELGQWLFGATSSQTIGAINSAIQAVTGADESDAQIQALTDPEIAGNFRIQLAAIAAARSAAAATAAQEQLASQLADLVNARTTTVQLAQIGSPLSWGAAIVSVLVLATFAAAMALTLLHALPENTEPVLNVLLGSLTAMATSVVSYWVGSSVGSARKDARLAEYVSNSR